MITETKAFVELTSYRKRIEKSAVATINLISLAGVHSHAIKIVFTLAGFTFTLLTTFLLSDLPIKKGHGLGHFYPF